MGHPVAIFKVNKNLRKYVECYGFTKEKERLVHEKLNSVDENTPSEEVRQLFDGICKVYTKDDFAAMRRRRWYINGAFLLAGILFVALYIVPRLM